MRAASVLSGVRLFQACVTTDKKLRFYNQSRLRAFIAEHPEIRVFSAHDPTFGNFTPSSEQVSGRALLAGDAAVTADSADAGQQRTMAPSQAVSA
jgi:hypothetical protein